MASRQRYNLGLLFDRHADQAKQTTLHIDRPFDIDPQAGRTLDGPALADLVRETAGWLHAAGVQRGDRVVVVKENHFDVVLLAAGAARIGSVPVLVAPIGAIEDIGTMISRAEPRLVVAGASIVDRAAAAGMALTGGWSRLLVVGAPRDPLPPHALTLDDIRGSAEAPVRPVSDDQPMVATHTSGTTGTPKLVLHSANTAIGRFPSRLERCRVPLLTVRRSDVVASAISFAHVRGLSWTAAQLSLTPRAAVVISDPALDNAARMLGEHRPTSLETLPNVFQFWEQLALSRPDLFARVRLFVSTFDAIHPRTVRTFLDVSRRRLPVWGWGLGQSETTGILVNLFTRHTVRPTGRRSVEPTSIGWPALVRVRIVDPRTGRRMAGRRPGLLLVSTRSRCLAYLGEPERYAAKVEGRWWNSGDLGQRATFGRVRMVDREVDMVHGMSCITVESTLLDRLPDAADVTILAVPEGPPIPILCMKDDRLALADWQRATHGLPRLGEPRLMAWEDVPRTATWKVRRPVLRAGLFGDDRAVGSGAWT